MSLKFSDVQTARFGRLNKFVWKKLPKPLRFVLKGLAAAFFVWLLLFLALKILPFKALTEFKNHQYSTRFYDRNNNLVEIMALDDGLRREWTPLEKIPPEVQAVFIEAEDSAFYKHHGVYLPAILRAAVQNAKNRRTVSGASTITMQLARMVVPRGSKRTTFGGKFKEAFLEFRIEAKLSKKAFGTYMVPLKVWPKFSSWAYLSCVAVGAVVGELVVSLLTNSFCVQPVGILCGFLWVLGGAFCFWAVQTEDLTGAGVRSMGMSILASFLSGVLIFSEATLL